MNWKCLPHGCCKGRRETTKLKLEEKVFVQLGKHYKDRCYTLNSPKLARVEIDSPTIAILCHDHLCLEYPTKMHQKSQVRIRVTASLIFMLHFSNLMTTKT